MWKQAQCAIHFLVSMKRKETSARVSRDSGSWVTSHAVPVMLDLMSVSTTVAAEASPPGDTE